MDGQHNSESVKGMGLRKIDDTVVADYDIREFYAAQLRPIRKTKSA